jgi:hypothetical protein
MLAAGLKPIPYKIMATPSRENVIRCFVMRVLFEHHPWMRAFQPKPENGRYGQVPSSSSLGSLKAPPDENA